MASSKGGLARKAEARLIAVKQHTPPPEQEIAALTVIIDLAGRVGRLSKIKHEEAAWSQACKALVAAISVYGQLFNKTDIDPTDEPEDIAALVAVAKHIAPRNYSRGKHVQGSTDKQRIKSSLGKGSPSQFRVGLSDGRIVELERDTLISGNLDHRGPGSYHAYKTHGHLGWEDGDEAFVMRAELSAASIHSHPRLS